MSHDDKYHTFTVIFITLSEIKAARVSYVSKINSDGCIWLRIDDYEEQNSFSLVKKMHR